MALCPDLNNSGGFEFGVDVHWTQCRGLATTCRAVPDILSRFIYLGRMPLSAVSLSSFETEQKKGLFFYLDYYVHLSNSSVIFNDVCFRRRIRSDFTVQVSPRDNRMNYYKTLTL